jgi:predicted nucleotidyltransferase
MTMTPEEVAANMGVDSSAVQNETPVDTGVTPDQAMFGNTDSGFFGGMNDLMEEMPDEVEFANKERVTATVTDAKEVSSGKGIMLNFTIVEGDHTGKKVEQYFKKPEKDDHVNSKKKFFGFIQAFFTKEQLASGQGSVDSMIGKTCEFTVQVREHNGNTYRDFVNFKVVDAAQTAQDNPFA